MKKFILLFFISFNLFAQAPDYSKISNVKMQYGISVDLRWEMVFKYGYLSNFRLGVSAGAGAQIGKNLTPYIQYTLATFQGGIGSSIGVKDRNKINLESLLTFGAITGINRDSLTPRQVYTMGKLNPNPLYHKYGLYLNLASVFIKRHTTFSDNISKLNNRFSQRVGTISTGFRGLDINYFNDAVPFHTIGLGDSKDRYYTGGGFINFNLNQFKLGELDKNPEKIVSNIFFGFDRFTGYFPDAFELAKELHLNEVPYGDQSAAYLNKGRFYGGVEYNKIPGLNTIFSYNDFDPLDVQYIIHKIRKQPLHKTLHKSNFGINNYFFYNYNTFYKQ